MRCHPFLLALSRGPINFHDFASYFRRQGCREALYLDGFVARLYWPGTGGRRMATLGG